MSTREPRILVVEDDRNDALLLERAFRKAGLPALDRVLRDGQEAIAYFEGLGVYADRNAYPLPTYMLLDLKVPKVSGLELLAWIRERAEHRHLRVVILSSSGEPTDRARARELGVDAYFVKPTRSADLLGVVREIARTWGLPEAGA